MMVGGGGGIKEPNYVFESIETWKLNNAASF